MQTDKTENTLFAPWYHGIFDLVFRRVGIGLVPSRVSVTKGERLHGARRCFADFTTTRRCSVLPFGCVMSLLWIKRPGESSAETETSRETIHSANGIIYVLEVLGFKSIRQ